jgi:nucleoside-diphosphate-sugar epimerase
MAEAAGVKPKIIHIPSDFINRFDKNWGDGLLGDKAHCMIFDNSKIRGINPEYKATIPFHQGAKEILAWYRVEKSRQVVDNADDEKMDTIIRHYLSAYGN